MRITIWDRLPQARSRGGGTRQVRTGCPRLVDGRPRAAGRHRCRVDQERACIHQGVPAGQEHRRARRPDQQVGPFLTIVFVFMTRRTQRGDRRDFARDGVRRERLWRGERNGGGAPFDEQRRGDYQHHVAAGLARVVHVPDAADDAAPAVRDEQVRAERADGELGAGGEDQGLWDPRGVDLPW